MTTARTIHLLVLSLVLAGGSVFAMSQGERDVQNLAHFETLQKIAARNPTAVRTYLQRVSNAYLAAGYDDLGPEFARSQTLFLIFPKAGKDENSRVFKTARASLRKLESALSQDAFVKLPAKTGESLPDFYHLAEIFLHNSRIALKIAKHGSATGAFMGGNGSLVVTNHGNDHFSISNSFGGGATLTGVSNNYAGTLALNSGTVEVTNFSGGTMDFSSISMVGATLSLDLGHSLTLLKIVALPPVATLPYDVNYTIIRTLATDETIGGVELPAGSTLLFFPSDVALPDGAQEVTLGTTFAILGPNSTAQGTGSLTFWSNNTLGQYTLVGATATFLQNVNFQWVAFPIASSLPAGMESLSLLLGRTYQTGALSLPAGTRIAMLGAGVTLPEGAVALPTSNFTLAPAP